MDRRTDKEWLAEEFDARRAHLRAVAVRMLGSGADAEDAVQEAWFRLARTDAAAIDNLGGWLTTVVARVCLDVLRSRQAKREEPIDDAATLDDPVDAGPEQETVLADSVGMAMLVVLEALTPAERVAFVLHDMFAVPFDDIAAIVGRTPVATRQLASRARSRVRGAAPGGGIDLERQRAVVTAFLDAARGGDMGALLALLDPDVVLRADAAAVEMGSPRHLVGAADVAATFSGRAQVARVAVVDGMVGLVFAPGGQVRVLFDLTIDDGRITGIEMVAEPEVLAALEIEISAS
jgi:RNA polymerase sigma-70 factor (ECF subfamily)